MLLKTGLLFVQLSIRAKPIHWEVWVKPVETSAAPAFTVWLVSAKMAVKVNDPQEWLRKTYVNT